MEDTQPVKTKPQSSGRSVFSSILVFFAGLLVGLVVLGWWLWPVSWVNGNMNVLAIDHQEDYLRAAIDSYSVNRDQALAEARYENLSPNSAAILANIQAEPAAVSPQAIVDFTTAVTGDPALLPTVPAEEIQPESGAARMTRAIEDSWQMLLLILLLLLFAAVIIWIVLRRSRRQAAQPKAAEEVSAVAVSEEELAAGRGGETIEPEPVVEGEAAVEAGEPVSEWSTEAPMDIADHGVGVGVAGEAAESEAAESEAVEAEAEGGIGLAGAAVVGAGAALAAGELDEGEAEAEAAAEDVGETEGETEGEGEAEGEGEGIGMAGAAAVGAGAALAVGALQGDEEEEAEPIAAEAEDEWKSEEELGIGEAVAVVAAGAALTEGEGEPVAVAEDEETVEEEAPEEEEEIPDPFNRLYYSDVDYIEGVGPVYGAKLKEAGLKTPADLLRAGATPKGRQELGETTGIPHSLILTWVNHVDLFRVKGIGQQYAELLEASGVDTVIELATRNPANLYEKLLEVNEQKKLVRRPPVLPQVESWILQAKSLPRIVNY